MLLGPVDVKSWRVYQIFKYGTVKRVVCTSNSQTSTMQIYSLHKPRYAECNSLLLSIGTAHFRVKGCWVLFFIFIQNLIEQSATNSMAPDQTRLALFAYVLQKRHCANMGLARNCA